MSEPGALPVGAMVVGVQKSATSSLFWLLQQHPEVCPGPRKEWHFFDDESRDWTAPDYSDYAWRPETDTQRLVVDATPSYLFWPRAMQRIGDYDPTIRLVASFRDPIERAFSQWMMEAHRRADFPDLSFFATKGPRLHAMRDDGPASVNRRRQFSIVERGLYGYQLQRGFDHVDPAQWLLLEFGEITADPITAAARVAGFLGLAPFPEPPLAEVRMSAPKRLRRDGPTAQDIELLAGHFATDLELFARLSGLAVSHWPTVQILDGRLAAGQLAEQLSSRVQGSSEVRTTAPGA